MADGRFVGSIGITGMGYVGLPPAPAFAEAGLSVVGIERDPDKVAALEGGDSYIEDVSSARAWPPPLLGPAAGDGGLRAASRMPGALTPPSAGAPRTRWKTSSGA